MMWVECGRSPHLHALNLLWRLYDVNRRGLIYFLLSLWKCACPTETSFFEEGMCRMI